MTQHSAKIARLDHLLSSQASANAEESATGCESAEDYGGTSEGFLSMPLLEFFEQRYIVDRPIAASTADFYRLHIERFARWLGRAPRLSDLNRQTANDFLNAVCAVRRVDTAGGAKSMLVALWNRARIYEPLLQSPEGIERLKQPKAERRASRVWGREQIQALLAVVAKLPGDFNGRRIKRADFWRAYILAAYETGLRYGDLAQLTFGDLRADGSLVTRNNRGRTFVVNISEAARRAILATNPSTRPHIFRVLERRHFFKTFKELIEAAGIEGTSEFLRRAAKMAEKVSPEAIELAAAVASSPMLAVVPYVPPAAVAPPPPKKPRAIRPEIVPKWRDFTPAPGGPRSLYNYFTTVYRPKKLLGKSPRTTKIYLVTFDRFGDFLNRTPTLHDLNEEALCGFLDYRLSHGCAHHTVDKEADKLKALANYAARKRHIPEFLDIPPINPAEVLPTCWTKEQFNALLAACWNEKRPIGSAPGHVWWTAFHMLCIACGERTEAMLSLRWEMLVGETLSVPANVRKGGRKPARYHLPPNVLASVESLREYTGETGVIFATKWKSVLASFYYRYTKLLKRAGLPSSRRFKPQCLRRTFASYLEAGGGDATEALQHTDRRVTRQSYLDTGVTLAGKESPASIVLRQLSIAQ